MKKYQFTGVEQNGLKQIQALRDFRDVKKGDIGGWIETENNLSQLGDAWVSGDAWVFDNARVYGDARVSDYAQVYDNAQVYGKAQVVGENDFFYQSGVTAFKVVDGSIFVHSKEYFGDIANFKSNLAPFFLLKLR